MRRAEPFIRVGCDWVKVGIQLDMPRPTALMVLEAFLPDRSEQIEFGLHRDELMRRTGLASSAITHAGNGLVNRGLASWDCEVGYEVLHLNDLGLMLALYKRSQNGGAS